MKNIYIYIYILLPEPPAHSHENTKVSFIEMANKPVLVGIARTRLRFDEESPHWLDMGMGMKSPTFLIGYGDGYENVHIPP